MGVERSALDLVARLGGLPVGTVAAREALTDPSELVPGTCPQKRLRVSWEPPKGYTIGGYVSPVGPAPTSTTTAVNGVVICIGSTFEFIGFEATWDGAAWRVDVVPASADATDGPAPADATAVAAVPASPAPVIVGPQPIDAWGPAIEPLADYQPQSTCDPSPKPGVAGFRDLVLRQFPTSRNLGISRECDAPDGVSEHKEGRAFDWGVLASDPGEHAMADQLLNWLFATDRYGNQYAMIRRLGVMYVIWDDHIWSAFKADEGWRPYNGPNPHTDHVHLSFSWAGALAQTSFWTGRVVDGQVVVPPAPPPGGTILVASPRTNPTSAPPTSAGVGVAASGPAAPSATSTTNPPPRPSTTTTTTTTPAPLTVPTTPPPPPTTVPLP